MFNFLKYRYFCLTLSVVVIFSIVGLFVYKLQTKGQAFNYSVDFQGGTQILLKFKKPVKSSKILNILEKKGFAGAATREFSGNEVSVRVKEYAKNVNQLSSKIIGYIKAEFPDNSAEVLQSDAIGPGIGKEIRWKSIRTVLIALLLMLLYIAFRFWSFSFAFGSVAALLHDALMMLGVFMIFNMEISVGTIAAILAVLGYSINDTIVIFSRIRSNMKSMSGAPIVDIVNTSLNQTLKRTLLTSFSTLLAVGAMFFLGGEALREFSLALIVGIFFGTYSSIYIASPVMIMLHKEKE
ncbi:protein translocase subunit SecF [Candidatus Dependentiae bacterium]